MIVLLEPTKSTLPLLVRRALHALLEPRARRGIGNKPTLSTYALQVPTHHLVPLLALLVLQGQ